ncbi:hypothetical protein ACOSQ3_017491 [Xanthoceras sorbifolium]
MVHEQRIEHLSSISQLNVANSSANYTANNQNTNKQPQRGGPANSRGNNPRGRGKGKNGAGWNNGNRPACQICGRSGHSAIYCYNCFDRAYQSFQGGNNN